MKNLKIPGGACNYLDLDDSRLLKSCRVDVYSASGPGGQKRNRKYSAVRITHRDTGISAIAEDSRSQQENKTRALRRLRKSLAFCVRSDTSSSGNTIIRHGESLHELLGVSLQNPSYPKLCAAVLDAVDEAGGKIGEAARSLSISTGQLNKVLRRDPDLFTAVNTIRFSNRLKPLKP